MANFGVRLARGVIETVFSAPFVAASGALGGYIYAKLADLPAGQVAKAWAIWSAAEIALTSITNTFTENLTARMLIKSVVTIVSGAIGIQELQKRGLIGPKMVIVSIVLRTLAVALFLGAAVYLPKQETQPA